jgi:hypothetical protein
MTERQLNQDTDGASGWEVRADIGRFACLLVHPPDATSCQREFASKQGLEVHRKRMGVHEPNLPSRRTVSRFFGLDEQDAKSLKASRNDSYVGNYRHTAKGMLAFKRVAAAIGGSTAVSRAAPAAAVPISPPLMAPEQETNTRGRLGGPLCEHCMRIEDRSPNLEFAISSRPCAGESTARIDRMRRSIHLPNENRINPFCEYLHLYTFCGFSLSKI